MKKREGEGRGRWRKRKESSDCLQFWPLRRLQGRLGLESSSKTVFDTLIRSSQSYLAGVHMSQKWHCISSPSVLSLCVVVACGKCDLSVSTQKDSKDSSKGPWLMTQPEKEIWVLHFHSYCKWKVTKGWEMSIKQNLNKRKQCKYVYTKQSS